MTVKREPVREVIVTKTIAKEEPSPTKTRVVINDQDRYQVVANEMHGYGRSNIKQREGNYNMSYSKRTDKKIKDVIVNTKSNSNEYRQDPFCNLI